MGESRDPNPTTLRLTQRVLSWIGVLALAGSGLYAGNVAGLRDHVSDKNGSTRAPAAARIADAPMSAAQTPARKTLVRSQPWWQMVETIESPGSPTPFVIDRGALQWRAKWQCETGRLVARIGGRTRPLIDASCPGKGMAYATQSGPVQLAIDAESGPKLTIEQEVDVPLEEPALPAMTTSAVVALGPFYPVDQAGTGQVVLYRPTDQPPALRLEHFFVTANTDLEIDLSPLPAPKSTAEFTRVPAMAVGPLDVTAGSLNFSVPPQIDLSRFHSVVIWCARLHSVYAAASLGKPPEMGTP